MVHLFAAAIVANEVQAVWTTSCIIYVIVEFLVGSACIVTNGLVLAAMWRYPNLRTATNCYIGSLAVADILVGLLVPPLIVMTSTGYPHNFYACLFVNSLVGCFVVISILNVVCVSVDRYFAVRYPLTHLKWATVALAQKVIAATWTLASVLGMIPFMGFYTDPKDFSECSYRRVIHLHYTVYIQFFGFFLPILFFVLFFYVRMFYAFRTAGRVRYKSIKDKKLLLKALKQPSVQETRLFKSLALIFTLFALCFLPLYILNCVLFFSPATPVSGDSVMFAIVLSHLHSVVNPVLYAMCQAGFRRALSRHAPGWARTMLGRHRAVVIPAVNGLRSFERMRMEAVTALECDNADNRLGVCATIKQRKLTVGAMLVHDASSVQQPDPNAEWSQWCSSDTPNPSPANWQGGERAVDGGNTGGGEPSEDPAQHATDIAPAALTVPVPRASSRKSHTVPMSRSSSHQSHIVPKSRTSSRQLHTVPMSRTSSHQSHIVPKSRTSSRQLHTVPMSRTSSHQSHIVPKSRTSSSQLHTVPMSRTSSRQSHTVPTRRSSSHESNTVPTSRASSHESHTVPTSRASSHQSHTVPTSRASSH